MFEKILNFLSELTNAVNYLRNIDERVSALEEKMNASAPTDEPGSNDKPADVVKTVETPAPENTEESSAAPQMLELGFRKHIPRAIHKRAMELYKSGIAIEEISVEVGIPCDKLKKHIYKTYILPARKSGNGEKLAIATSKSKWDLDDTRLCFAMHKSGRTLETIASVLNRSINSVRSKIWKINNDWDPLMKPDGSPRK